VGVCFKAPCTMRGMSEHQQQYVTALEVYKRANEAYEQGEYFTAEQLFTELLEMEEVQRGHGFPGGSVKIQVGDDKRLEGTEFVLNRREHDKAYFLKAMSLVKQQKYQEAVTSFKQAKERTTLEDVKSAITNTLEGLDCTKRSFALCNKKEPSEFCYRDSQESSCKQCSEQTNCGVFDSQMACTQYSCGRRCVWNEGACSDTPPQRGAV
jgi:tetratricopeptide (TPR) repeat protein